MLQTVKNLPFHRLKQCQTALKTVDTVPSSPFSKPSDTVSDGEAVNIIPSGVSTISGRAERRRADEHALRADHRGPDGSPVPPHWPGGRRPPGRGGHVDHPAGHAESEEKLDDGNPQFLRDSGSLN